MTRAMKGLQGFASMAAAAFEKTLSVMERLIPVAQLLVDVIGTFATTAVQVVGSAAESFTLLVVAISTATTALITFVKFMDELGLGQLTIIGQFRNIGIGLKALKDGFSAVVSFAASIPATIGSAFMAIPGLFGAASDSAAELATTSEDAANGMAARFRSALSSVAGYAGAALSAVGGAIVNFRSRFIQPVIDGIAGVASGLANRIKSVAETIQRWSASIAGVGESIAGFANRIVGPLTEAGKQFAAAGTAAAALAVSAGLSVRAVTELGYAAEQSGTNVETVAGAVESVNTKLLEAAAGSEAAAAGFAQLGFDVNNLLNQVPEDRFIALGVAIAKIEDPLDRAAAASKVFGTSNQSLIGMFSKGTAGINEMRKEAERLGLVMTGPQAAAAKMLTEAYKSVQDSLTGLWRTLGAAVAPQLAETAKNMASVIKAVTAWVAKNQPLIAQVFKIASGIATVGTGLAMLAGALPMILAVGSALGVGALAWDRYGTSATAALNYVKTLTADAWAEAQRVFGGIADAIKGGDLELAVQVAWSGAQNAWIEGMRAIADVTGVVFGGILNSLAAGEWRDAASQAWNAIQSVFSLGVSALDGVWTGLQNTIDTVITYLRQQINVAIHEIAKLAMAGLQAANNLANVLGKYDPTGKIQEMQMAVGKSLKGSALVQAAKTLPGAANAALDMESLSRQAGRAAGLNGRESGRQSQRDQLGFAQQVAADKATKDAAQRSSDASQTLQDLLDKAAAARQAAEIRPIADLDRRDKLAAAAAGTSTANGGFGATFSAAAMVAQQGGGSIQSQIAKATQASAKSLQLLVEADKKRQQITQGLQVQVTA